MSDVRDPMQLDPVRWSEIKRGQVRSCQVCIPAKLQWEVTPPQIRKLQRFVFGFVSISLSNPRITRLLLWSRSISPWLVPGGLGSALHRPDRITLQHEPPPGRSSQKKTGIHSLTQRDLGWMHSKNAGDGVASYSSPRNKPRDLRGGPKATFQSSSRKGRKKQG